MFIKRASLHIKNKYTKQETIQSKFKTKYKSMDKNLNEVHMKNNGKSKYSLQPYVNVPFLHKILSLFKRPISPPKAFACLNISFLLHYSLHP